MARHVQLSEKKSKFLPSQLRSSNLNFLHFYTAKFRYQWKFHGINSGFPLKFSSFKTLSNLVHDAHLHYRWHSFFLFLGCWKEGKKINKKKIIIVWILECVSPSHKKNNIIYAYCTTNVLCAVSIARAPPFFFVSLSVYLITHYHFAFCIYIYIYTWIMYILFSFSALYTQI